MSRHTAEQYDAALVALRGAGIGTVSEADYEARDGQPPFRLCALRLVGSLDATVDAVALTRLAVMVEGYLTASVGFGAVTWTLHVSRSAVSE